MNTGKDQTPGDSSPSADSGACDGFDDALAGAFPGPDDDSETGWANELNRLRLELAESEKKALRYQADLDNFRRRTRKEAEDLSRYAALPLVNELLDALDNLNRAIDAGQSLSDTATLSEGVRMVANQIAQTLSRFGCQPIASLGEPFDPNLHQAVQMVSSPSVPRDHVAAELRPGFRIHERIIRPAQVVISTGPGQ